jgi:hypothetical protein
MKTIRSRCLTLARRWELAKGDYIAKADRSSILYRVVYAYPSEQRQPTNVICFDNLRRLSEELADATSRPATGERLGGKELYTDHDEAAFDTIMGQRGGERESEKIRALAESAEYVGRYAAQDGR